MIHQLVYNTEDEETTSISDYELGDFDLVAFWRSGTVDGLALQTLRLEISKGIPADYLPNPLSLPIVSARLKEHLAASNGNLRFLRLPQTVLPCREPITYYLMEFLRSYDVMVDERHYDPKKLPPDDIFRHRVRGSGSILLSDFFARSFIGRKFRPVAFIRKHEKKA